MGPNCPNYSPPFVTTIAPTKIEIYNYYPPLPFVQQSMSAEQFAFCFANSFLGVMSSTDWAKAMCQHLTQQLQDSGLGSRPVLLGVVLVLMRHGLP